jgi:hypothetical protein
MGHPTDLREPSEYLDIILVGRSLLGPRLQSPPLQHADHPQRYPAFEGELETRATLDHQARPGR